MDSVPAVLDWKAELPTIPGRLIALREPTRQDVASVFDLLSLADAARFGLQMPLTELTVRAFIDRALQQRAAGHSFTYAIVPGAGRALVGLIQVRQLDPAFETSEWECTVDLTSRGSGVFLEAARLAGSFAFDRVGTHRLEARVPLQNGRANGALRKLGAVQEGILRRSLRQGHEYFDQVLWAVLKEDWGHQRVSTAPRVH